MDDLSSTPCLNYVNTIMSKLPTMANEQLTETLEEVRHNIDRELKWADTPTHIINMLRGLESTVEAEIWKRNGVLSDE